MKVIWHMPPTPDAQGRLTRTYKVVELPDHIAEDEIEQGHCVRLEVLAS